MPNARNTIDENVDERRAGRINPAVRRALDGDCVTVYFVHEVNKSAIGVYGMGNEAKIHESNCEANEITLARNRRTTAKSHLCNWFHDVHPDAP